MNRIHRKIEYALIALRHMSQKGQGELTTAKEVAERYESPFDATARVMQIMAQKGLLRSEQGVAGGYLIIKDLNKVYLHDLIEMIQGPAKVARCLHKDDPCEIRSTCNIVSPMSYLNQKLTDFYKSLSLRELLTGSARNATNAFPSVSKENFL
jgi:Rrf2 family nitric oxide-sensitive transcriptional repressor